MIRIGFRLAVAAVLGFAASANAGPRHAARIILCIDSVRVYCCADRAAERLLLGNIPRAQRRYSAIRNSLDSLGFFAARWDTLSADTLMLAPGPRAGIGEASLNSDLPITLDSVGMPRAPFPYDAGIINRISRALVWHAACRGHPFALVTVSLERKAPEDSGAAAPESIACRFALVANALCRFGDPAFAGSFKTQRRVLAHDCMFVKFAPYDARAVDATVQSFISRPYIASARGMAPRILAHAAGAADSADTIVAPFLIADRSGLGIDGSLAYQSGPDVASPLSGLVNVSLLNILGRGEAVNLHYRGERSMQQFDLSTSLPWVLGTRFSADAGFGLEIREDAYSHVTGSAGGRMDVGALWEAGAHLRASESAVDTVEGDSSGIAVSRYYGFDVGLSRRPERLEAGVFARELSVGTGAGVVDRGEQLYNRWHADFSVGAHLPLRGPFAARVRVAANSLFTRETDLPDIDLYRLGGSASVRGYADNEVPVRSALTAQSELLWYFSHRGAAYLFADGGAGYRHFVSLSASERTDLFGYGVGMRLPAGIGSLSIEWARNISDRRGFGRIHLNLRNSLAAGPSS
jgi:hypothetical protein